MTKPDTINEYSKLSICVQNPKPICQELVPKVTKFRGRPFWGDEVMKRKPSWMRLVPWKESSQSFPAYSAMYRHSEKMALYESIPLPVGPCQTRNLSGSWPWISSLQNNEKYPVYGFLLYNPNELRQWV
jgi:hypothetical protein